MTVRYKKSVEPIHTDGRDIDLDVAVLTGEAASQSASGSSDKHIANIAQTSKQVPAPTGDPTYYDRPLLKEPIWEWAIPTYYYVGGLTGASLVLAAAAQLAGSNKLERLIRRCHWIGFAGACLSGALLVYDLGRPSRFFNMLRVFRPTSPMNMGAWILSGTAMTAAATVFLRRRRGVLGGIGRLCGILSGAFGMALATYTGVLVANSAIPLWQESRRLLPVLFGASAMSSVGSAFEIFIENPAQARITKAFGVTGQLVELTAAVLLDKQAPDVPRVMLPLKRGFSGFMWKAAALMTAASTVLAVLPKPSRRRRIGAGVLGTAGALVMRFAIEHAGVMSSRDARASFHVQRARQAGADAIARG